MPSETVEHLREWLQENGVAPEDYIVSVFNTRDVVLLAEDHAIKHNLLLAQALIPRLHKAGVYTLGMEFGASEDQAALDALVGVSGPAGNYDEAAARRLMFNYNTGWAFKEYMDLYRVAWAFNRTRPAHTQPFRILNLSYRYNWRMSSPVRTPENTRLVFPKGNTEPYRAEIIRREILDKGEKVLVLTGTIHAFTRYAPPVFDYLSPGFYRLEEGYMGQTLYRMAPDRVFTILLHQPFDSRLNGAAQLVYPANGVLDAVMQGLGNRPVGFDLVGTPMGNLPDGSFFATGYPDFTLSQLADGYVYTMPFDRFEGCTVDDAFMTSENWSEAQANYPDPHWHKPPDTPDEYWTLVRSYADIAQRYARLHQTPD
ncbi:MAG: hypothetical protein R3C44_17510 [Chloroflexota bacterium]